MIVHQPTMKLLQVTELIEQVVKAAEKVAIDNADDVPAEQAVPGEPPQDTSFEGGGESCLFI